jgi:hypothetical protein
VDICAGGDGPSAESKRSCCSCLGDGGSHGRGSECEDCGALHCCGLRKLEFDGRVIVVSVVDAKASFEGFENPLCDKC